LSGAILLLAGGCQQSNAKLGRPLNSTEQRGEKLFAANCKKCHAADSGLATQGPDLAGLFDKKFLPSGAPANDERVKNVLQYGRRSMPAFGQVLDDSQIDSIIAYLKTQ
jgi:mono/diheme cytochrome c family protein